MRAGGRAGKRRVAAKKTSLERREDEALESARAHFYTWQAMWPTPIELKAASKLLRSVRNVADALKSLTPNTELTERLRERVPTWDDRSGVFGVLAALESVLVDRGFERVKGGLRNRVPRYWIACVDAAWRDEGLGEPHHAEGSRFFQALERFTRPPAVMSRTQLRRILLQLPAIREEMSTIAARPLSLSRTVPADFRPFGNDATTDEWEGWPG